MHYGFINDCEDFKVLLSKEERWCHANGIVVKSMAVSEMNKPTQTCSTKLKIFQFLCIIMHAQIKEIRKVDIERTVHNN